ncbi:hypothetical protein CDAR_399211 [Caerostris darwini]|uniref:Uncharacterized protein n=1 Tax=Caerostris darwini TaxID=1538125 RepID=A0AAV4SZS2_9ARAC|nr:hypothetical protein CDAR_399211 [Caerostris darwini]
MVKPGGRHVHIFCCVASCRDEIAGVTTRRRNYVIRDQKPAESRISFGGGMERKSDRVRFFNLSLSSLPPLSSVLPVLSKTPLPDSELLRINLLKNFLSAGVSWNILVRK